MKKIDSFLKNKKFHEKIKAKIDTWALTNLIDFFKNIETKTDYKLQNIDLIKTWN